MCQLIFRHILKNSSDYREVNKKLWNSKVEHHVVSDFYDNDNFIQGKSSLNEIEIDLLGDIKGKSILHLQCHFGQDTISLARLGAIATGIDLSDKSIELARDLAKKTNTPAKFICSDLYELPNQLNEKFDIVFTSYGTIGWLPDINKWASVVSHFLKPGGTFVFAEFHPVVWMFDDDLEKVTYRYFNSDAIIEENEGTYANRDAEIREKSISWNHGLAEVVSSLLNEGLTLNSLNEYDYSPYNCFNNLIEVAPNKFRFKHLDDKIPMVYSICATKPI